MGDGPILETFVLGPQWPTIDPFLFVAHHRDAYPSGRPDFGPAADLGGRDLGADFAAKDGWNMYHGTVVPGFPQHPHRGFETITYVRTGLIDHADSLGAAARFGHGDTQWLTAGSGVVHSEMFPLLDGDGPNPLELFQIWLNLPAAAKMADPAFKMIWSGETPVVEVSDGSGPNASVTIIAGEFAGTAPPTPPVDSWAARPEAEVAVWHLRLDPGASIRLPPTRGPETDRVLYLFEGGPLVVGDGVLEPGHGARLAVDEPLSITADDRGAEALVLQGAPIAEPVAQYGPFVMNDRAGIEQAIDDYRATGFGGWPWAGDDPTHGRESRFARHPDGHETRPSAAVE